MNKNFGNSYLYKTLTSKKVALFSKDEVSKIIEKSESIKELYINVADEINQKGNIILNNSNMDNSNMYNFFLIDNIGLGELDDEKIQAGITHNKAKNTYHFAIGNYYADPDKISYMLYYLAKCKYGRKRINNHKVSLDVITREQGGVQLCT